jgi:hypothetical protein
MTDERIKKKHILQCKDGINMSEQTELPVPWNEQETRSSGKN